jgi:Asp-tRNA(Asn)/Glu-tRNA(Gln) amidotransferase A subunit family amidase
MIGGVEHDFTMALVRLTSLFNHTGHPVLSLPVGGATDNLAASLQIIGKRNNENTILQLGALLN